MYFKKIETEGLAHFSYMIGAGTDIAVIDPIRDVEIYMHEARIAGVKIKYILETHRNEDFVAGSMELADKTGAVIYISGHEALGHVYGEKIMDGFELKINKITLKAIHTPGHTLGHLCYAVYEEGVESAYMVFSGDCLFMGDLGRTDFYGEENLVKMTGLMYESVFEKLLPLGDQVLLCPAHGAGSACGDDMDERPYSSLGYEKTTNSLLKVGSKEAFIKTFAKMRIKPRYFDHMEILNVNGADFVHNEVVLNTLTVHEIAEMMSSILLIDARTKEGFIGGHIPGSIYLPKGNITAFLGSIYEPDVKIAFVIDGKVGEMETIYWYCRRIGFDSIVGYLPDGIEKWQKEGHEVDQLSTISAKAYKEMDKGDHFILLDIRDYNETKPQDPDENKVSIPLKSLYQSLEKLKMDQHKTIYVLCGSGNRATTAASYLNAKGYKVIVITGGAEMYRNLE
ncbi:MAG TPA: hydroxyacylglutathione hydrolase [Clostridiales bacterium UBA8960]|nr:hydroxyacylglutathione hydrolase [Clostridiales bacterium UBA8960]